MQFETDKLSSRTTDRNFIEKRSRSSHRIQYEAEVEAIKKQIGDIENIKDRLGLSARKMTQLLLVDPSAWNRWATRKTPVPPHIYRALQWYLALQEKNPGFTPQVFLSTQVFSQKDHQRDLLAQLKNMENSQKLSLEKIQQLETDLIQYRSKLSILSRGIFIFVIAVISATFIVKILG